MLSKDLIWNNLLRYLAMLDLWSLGENIRDALIIIRSYFLCSDDYMIDMEGHSVIEKFSRFYRVNTMPRSYCPK